MALPHMPTSYTTRKNIYEAAIVRRRNYDNDYRESWGNTAKYFAKEDIKATKQNAWSSKQAFMNSMDAYKSRHDKEIKKIELQRRRLRLADMLQKERDYHEAEIMGLSKDNYERLNELKDRVEVLSSAREEKRKKVAEDLLYEHWRQNNPDIRELEFDQHKRHVMDQWGVQQKEREEAIENARIAKEEFERQLEEERLMALKKEQEKKQDQLEEVIELKSVLKKQIEELRMREQEAEALKAEEDEVIQLQWDLEKLEEERKAREQLRKKVEFGRILLRQHTAQLRRKSKQIQEELEEDRKVLSRLAEEESKEIEVMTSRKEKAKANAAWMMQVIEEQLKLEKAREAELDMLYQDEAAILWQKRESEWAKERQARERLMQEVMDSRQEQIDKRREKLRQQQEESLEQREILLEEIERANQLTRREQEEEEEAKKDRKKELESQITSRRDEKITARQRLEEELAAEKAAEDDYEEMLRQEAERMKIVGFQPKIHGRPTVKKQGWM